MTTQQEPHDLNINSYTLDELLDLFELSYDITMEDLKRAKRKVLQLHPDKSRLPADYFLFYKRAFEKIVDLFEDIQKQARPITKEATKYNAASIQARGGAAEFSKHQHDLIKKESAAADFNKKFNELFEKNMLPASAAARAEKNSWFSDTAPDPTLTAGAAAATSTATMAAELEKIREKTAATTLTKYRGVSETYSFGAGGNPIYEDDDTDAPIECDPFRGLKYEDIRRVHKDETILPITTKEAARVAQSRPMTVDEFVASRTAAAAAAPTTTQSEAERILEEQYKASRQRILEKQHKASLKTDEYAEKNRAVMAQFLRLT